jgi:hypothetical protein
MAAEKNQFIFTVTLSVKAADEYAAMRELTNRLNQWFLETSQADCVKGFGYPFGSLLHYSLHNQVGRV